MCLRHKSYRMEQGSITARISWLIIKTFPPLAWIALLKVHIRRHTPSLFFHTRKQSRLEYVMQKGPQLPTELIPLRAQQGHRILIIGAIADMIVNLDIRVHPMKDPGKRPGIPAVTFGKIPVEIEVLRIAPETEALGTILVDPGKRGPVQRTANIIEGDHRQGDIVRQMDLFCDQVPKQHHAGVYAVGFSGMDAIIDKKYHLSLLMPYSGVCDPVIGIQHNMIGITRIAHAHFLNG